MINQRHHCVRNFAANIVEVNIDALWTRIFEYLLQFRALVIDSCVNADLFAEIFILVIAAGDADRAAAFDLRDLANGQAHRARRAGNDHSLALLWLTNVEQTEIGGETWHTEYAKCSGDGNTGWHRDFHQAFSFRNVVKPPAKHSGDDVSRLKLRRTRFNYLANRAALDHLPHFKRRHVRTSLAHAAAQIWIN